MTPEQIHTVLRDIIRRDPDVWRRVQRDQALGQAFGFETEAKDLSPPPPLSQRADRHPIS